MFSTFRLLFLTWLLAWAAPATPAQAQTTPQAKLAIANRTILTFRAALSGYPPEERVDGARRRLERALARGGALTCQAPTRLHSRACRCWWA